MRGRDGGPLLSWSQDPETMTEGETRIRQRKHLTTHMGGVCSSFFACSAAAPGAGAAAPPLCRLDAPTVSGETPFSCFGREADGSSEEAPEPTGRLAGGAGAAPVDSDTFACAVISAGDCDFSSVGGVLLF